MIETGRMRQRREGRDRVEKEETETRRKRQRREERDRVEKKETERETLMKMFVLKIWNASLISFLNFWTQVSIAYNETKRKRTVYAAKYWFILIFSV